jgi:hypothetical protein
VQEVFSPKSIDQHLTKFQEEANKMTDLLLEEMDKNNQVNPHGYFQFYVANIIWFLCSGKTTNNLHEPMIKDIFEANLATEKALSIESNLRDFIPLVAPFFDSSESQKECDRIHVQYGLPIYEKMVKESTITEPPNLAQVLERTFPQNEVVGIISKWGGGFFSKKKIYNDIKTWGLFFKNFLSLQ